MYSTAALQADADLPALAEPVGLRILKPGENCWRIEMASKAAVLVDAADYFCHLETSLQRARRSILIVGWDFDGRIRLCPDKEACDSPSLGETLRALVEEKPELEVRVLVWSTAVVHAPGAPLPLLFGTEWDDHPRIHVRLDTQHPIYGAHHQKIVCIDDTMAFAGGIDLTVERWDTNGHTETHPHRLNPDGSCYSPVHDIQMAVEGDAARALADLARERWRVATDEELGPAGQCDRCWPEALDPDFIDMPIAIARTCPAWGKTTAVREAAALTADCLRAAKSLIYIEAQYLTAASIGEILGERLQEPEGPEIVVIMTRSSHGAMEQLVMGENRDRLIRKLRSLDRYGRLRIFYPAVPGKDGECEIHIHAKLIIVDDDFIRVGSSNLNNRSMGLDTECDLAIEAQGSETRRTIVRLRNRLLAEHLDVSPGTVADTFAAEGSLIRTIEALNGNPRGLRALDRVPEEGPTVPMIGTAIFDPDEPLDLMSLLRGGKDK
jgi:phosphatidylserine/phosphatidylglycerophosphate/cardiolipin synthase-like enzyme